jgi:hypothetical protein
MSTKNPAVVMSKTAEALGQPLNLLAQANALDAEDGLRHLREEFLIPTKADLARKTLAREGTASRPPY